MFACKSCGWPVTSAVGDKCMACGIHADQVKLQNPELSDEFIVEAKQALIEVESGNSIPYKRKSNK